jgi:glucose-specific phosphotransferase system IIA component
VERLEVLSPVAGRVVPLAGVPDPVFSQAIVGPGAAVDPVVDSPGTTTAVAPVAGVLIQAQSHAFIIMSDDGVGILTHLGIDTVEMGGEGFTARASAGERVEAGQPIIDWDPEAVRASGRSAVVPVIALDTPPHRLTAFAADDVTAAIFPGSPLFVVSG